MKLGSVLAVRKNEVESLSKALELRKAKYTKRWKGKDGKWHYKYGKELKGDKKPSEADIARNLKQGKGNKKPSKLETARNFREGKTKNKKSSKDAIERNLQEGRGIKKKEVVAKKEVGTLPQNVNTLTMDNIVSLIKQTVKIPLKTLRRNQDIVEQQKEKAYKDKNHRAYKRLEVMGEIYQAAVDIKEFKDATPEEWAKNIIPTTKKYERSFIEE